MENNLFSDFASLTKLDWLNQAMKDLKGKNFEQTLVWKTDEQFDIQPYYNEEDLTKLPIEAIQAAQKSVKTPACQNRAVVRFDDEKKTNLLIISLLEKGINEICIDFEGKETTQIQWTKLLNNIKLSDNPLYLKGIDATVTLNELLKVIPYQPKGGFSNDIIANSFKSNSSINNSTWENTKKLLLDTEKYPHFNVISVQSHLYHNAGANAVQELSFTLATAIEYLNKLTDVGLSAQQIINKLEFSISVGTNYFMEIAKLRALRYLWSKVLEAYDCSELIENCLIHAQTSFFYNAKLSPYTNMLRATTEAMSAIIGGSNALTTLAYDAANITENNTELGNRIAHNVLSILKEEAYLDKTIDPSAGSYYIENLTFQLASSAWEMLQKIELEGGMLEAFKKGFVRKELDKSFSDKVQNMQNGKIMIGVNKFRTEEITNQASQKEITNENILIERRLAEAYE